MSQPKLITFRRIGRQTLKSECLDCIHQKVCKTFEAVQNIPILPPHFISFDCIHYKREEK